MREKVPNNIKKNLFGHFSSRMQLKILYNKKLLGNNINHLSKKNKKSDYNSIRINLSKCSSSSFFGLTVFFFIENFRYNFSILKIKKIKSFRKCMT